MKDVIQIPLKEYEAMKETILLLKDTELLKKVNRLVELMYEEKYGLYLGNDTSDLTTASIQKNWQQPNSVWDNV
ncbi:MAG: hypothetical protein M3352_07955 [Bacteroidota bacterium]|nr:hypothetical protein [Bacteroidota bacterium]